VAASWTQRAPSCSSWCLLWHLGSMGLVRCQMLLVAIHNVQFVDKATRAIMGRWHYVHAAVWYAVAGVGRLCGRPAAVRGRRERHEGGSTHHAGGGRGHGAV